MLIPSIVSAVTVALATGGTFAATYVVGADPRPSASNGRVTTDAYNDATAQFDSDVHHFGYVLGQSAGNPYFTSDPGFNAVVGSGLPAGQQLRFDVVRHLSRWSGVGAPSFKAVPNNESVLYQFGATTATVTGTTDAVTGFPISNIASGGSLHRHLNAFLQAGADNAAAPAAGLYFTAMRLSVSGGALAHSDALYIAYNNGLADADFKRGMTYLANPIVGDANFDGSVDFADLLVLAKAYQANTDASWFDGDFTGDRAVNFDDLLALAKHYGSSNAMTAGALPAAFDAQWSLARSLATEGRCARTGIDVGARRLPDRASSVCHPEEAYRRGISGARTQ